MSGGQLYSAMPTTCSPEQGLPTSTPAMAASDWFPQTAPFHNQYMTPYSTAPLESGKWTPQVPQPFQDASLAPFTMASAPALHHYMINAPGRPRSSPSTFGPAPETLIWQQNPLGIQYEQNAIDTSIMMPPATYDAYAAIHQLSAPNTPELRQPVPRRPHHPVTVSTPAMTPGSGKRKRDDGEQSDPESASRRRKRTASVNSADLSEDDRYLVKLKEEDSLPWKEIATRFHTEKGKSFQVAALQMRYKRLRERFRVWEDQDINALKLAHEYWQKYKWEIISQKMTEFGSSERWPARNCARKWQDMELMTTSFATATPAMMAASSMTHFHTSPVEAPLVPQYPFLPMHVY